jgi:hypothetical protein
MLGRTHWDCQHQSFESLSIWPITRLKTIENTPAAAAWKQSADDLAVHFLREMGSDALRAYVAFG